MLRTRVLGRPAEDNALWVVADSGQGQTRLLLDCGAHVLDGVPFAEVQATDHLLFSHLHMDHVGGFDDFFRATFDRPAPTHAWGPPGTARILGHRFQGSGGITRRSCGASGSCMTFTTSTCSPSVSRRTRPSPWPTTRAAARTTARS
ncbi:MBL fold metallo-hydrolase [Deinococcus aquaticus]|uniref:MBL fold metallo-hydrolase n=1 Tax=Deinococcus aquaticus TaxID=328692 RepID=UPI00360B44CA